MWKELFKIWKSHSLLEQAWKESFEMLEIDRTMFLEAVRVLRESDDAAINQDIRKLDRKVNKFERAVRRKVMTHCAVEGASELPSGMVLISVVIDIERVGDYCKNIIDLANSHPQRLGAGQYEDELRVVEAEVRSRFDRTIEALRTQDADKARALMETYRTEVVKICDRIVHELVAGEGGKMGVSATDATALALYTRYLKRISGHLYNTVTSVVNPFPRIGYKEKKAPKPEA